MVEESAKLNPRIDATSASALGQNGVFVDVGALMGCGSRVD
jgi:hypothetical protein